MGLFHFHSFSPWRVDHVYDDVSWGDSVSSATLIRVCAKCGDLQKKDVYGVTFTTEPVQLLGNRLADEPHKRYIEFLEGILTDAARANNGMVPLADAVFATRAAVQASRIAEARGIVDALRPASLPGTSIDSAIKQLRQRMNSHRRKLDAVVREREAEEHTKESTS